MHQSHARIEQSKSHSMRGQLKPAPSPPRDYPHDYHGQHHPDQQPGKVAATEIL
jgi:hypothetical protein